MSRGRYSRNNDMPISDHFRKADKARAAAGFNLDLFIRLFYRESADLENTTVDLDLVRARLADGFRDAGRQPLPPAQFPALTHGLDSEGIKRLALAFKSFDLPQVPQALPSLLKTPDMLAFLSQGFIEPCRSARLLTMSLLRTSPLRCEEFARTFIKALGAAILSETPAQSQDRLNRIDYARLCADAERARLSAEDRVQYLRKLQEEQEAKLGPRGKW